MDTLKEYQKTVDATKKKLSGLLKNMKETDMATIASDCGVSFGLVAMYKSGKGTNLETMVSLIEAIEKLKIS